MVSSTSKDIELVESKPDIQEGELVTNFVPLKDDNTVIRPSASTPLDGSVEDKREDDCHDPNTSESSKLDQNIGAREAPAEQLTSQADDTVVKVDEAAEVDVDVVDVDEEIAYAKYLAEEGPIIFKIPAFLGGVAMVASSIVDFFYDLSFIGVFPSLDFTITSFYIFAFGLFICALEGTAVCINIPAVHIFVQDYMKLLQFMWGRGVLYIFVGSLSYCLLSDYSIICGLYMMGLGALTCMAGVFYNRNLEEKQRLVPDFLDLQAKFFLFDTDQDGYLDENGFRDMVVSAEGHIQWEDMDFVAEFSRIDQNGDELISFGEFQAWFESVQRTQQTPVDLV